MLAAAKIRYLVVHCADTPDDQALDARDIHQMHLRVWLAWHWLSQGNLSRWAHSAKDVLISG